MSLNVPFTRGTHWICYSNICSSGKVLLAGRCGRNNAILEETCCWEKDNSGCLNRFDVYNSCYVLFVRKLPPPPLKAHTHFSTATPPPPPSPVGCLCFTRGICNLLEPEERKHLHIETLCKFKYEDHCWARSALKVNLSRNEIPFPLQLGARQLPRRLLSTREWFKEHPTISR